MRNGMPGHSSGCLCDACMENAIALAKKEWERHGAVCPVQSEDRHMVEYHADPKKPQKYPDQLYCSACNLIVFRKEL